MKKELAIIICGLSIFALGSKQTIRMPLTDLHIHKVWTSLDAAVEKSKKEHIEYGILASCGLGYKIHSDSQIDSFLLVMKKYPMFYVGLQAEGREWVNMFSKEYLKKLDYVVTDAMTFTDLKGRRNRIYIRNETWIDEENQFMDYYVKTIVDILNNEPIDIYVNPTYLPEQIAAKYDKLWTDERMDKVISAAVKNGKAIEINNRYRIPSEIFITKAKAAGVKFTVGTNNNSVNFTGAEYAIGMIRKCGLKKEDFFLPKTKNGVPRVN
jgi:histidinol phosphatase-like PHP family hydrolase